MANLTLSEIKQRCRERADMKESNFVEDNELTFYINQSISELHDMLVQSYGSDYYVKDITFQSVAGQKAYDLDTIIVDQDFYKLRALDAALNGDEFTTLRKFNFNERNRFQNAGSWNQIGISNVRYRLVGSNLRFTPAPDQNTEIQVWYIPRAKTLTLDTDSYNDFNGWIEYVIVDCAIKMLNKEESDVSILNNEKLMLKRRIEEVSQNRDAGDSESIQDVNYENDNHFYGKSSS